MNLTNLTYTRKLEISECNKFSQIVNHCENAKVIFINIFVHHYEEIFIFQATVLKFYNLLREWKLANKCKTTAQYKGVSL